MRSVDVSKARTFLQKKFLDRQLMMDKEQLIKLVSGDLSRKHFAYSRSLYEPAELEKDQWFDISDSSVWPVNFQQVRKKEAYLLFYERVQ